MDYFIRDIDHSLRLSGIGDMSIGKYVKRYVKKFYFRVSELENFFSRKEDFNNNEFNEYLIKYNIIYINNEKYSSKIISISKVVNPVNRTFNIGIEIPSSILEEIKPNQILNALLIDYQNDKSISVSSNIIYNDERGSYVFIVSDFDGEMIARKVPVLTGKSFEYETEILSGLTGEELVIDKGSTEVMDGSFVKIKN